LLPLSSLWGVPIRIHKRLTGHSRPFLNNTEKLELPSISQVQTRGPADIPWLNHHHSSQRSLFSSDRLPNLQLPQTYPTSVSSGTNSSRIGSLDSSSNYSSNHYTPSLTSASSYPSVNNGTGLKTPSPSPASSAQPHVHTEDTVQQAQYPSQPHSSQVYGQDSESYSSAMNPSQQYVDSQHSHMSGGPSYAPQSQTSGGMAHYPQYPQQAPPLQPVHGSYAPSSSYGQYGYATGVTSPQAAGQPSNAQLLPLPGETNSPTNLYRTRLTSSSNAIHWSCATWIRNPWCFCSSLSATTDLRRHRSSRSSGHETPSNSYIVGRRRKFVLPSRSQGCVRSTTRRYEPASACVHMQDLQPQILHPAQLVHG